MRYVLLLVTVGVVALCLTSPAYAGGKISLYADFSRESCELTDTYPGVVQIHMFYEGDLEAQSVLFAAPTPACWSGAIWLGDVIVDPWLAGLGDTHSAKSGALINLRGCESGTLYLGYMTFQADGRGEKCCTYELVASEQNGDPAVIDCTNGLVAVDTGNLVVNPHGRCHCIDGNVIVAVEQSTWGLVKSLYR